MDPRSPCVHASNCVPLWFACTRHGPRLLSCNHLLRSAVTPVPVTGAFGNRQHWIRAAVEKVRQLPPPRNGFISFSPFMD